MSRERTPFRTVSHVHPKLPWRTRFNALVGAVALALLVVSVVVVVWDFWVHHLRAQEPMEPVEVWYMGEPEPP